MTEPFKLAEKILQEGLFEKLADVDNSSFKCVDYALVTAEGDVTAWFGQGCFVRLVKGSYHGEPPVYFVTNPGLRYWEENPRTEEYKALHRKYGKWLANKSVFADAFITKDPDILMTKGAIFRTDFPFQYVIQAAIAHRYIYEKTRNIKAWQALRDEFGGNRAFFLSHWYCPAEDAIGPDNIKYYRIPPGMWWPVNGNDSINTTFDYTDMDKGRYLRFINNNRSEFQYFKSFRDRPYGKGFADIWGPKTGERLSVRDKDRLSGSTVDGMTIYLQTFEDIKATVKELEGS